MEKIESFQINHLLLKSGLYVSRVDTHEGVFVTTFDMRVTEPNNEPPMDVPAIHTIEHLFATFLRNSEKKEDVVYFGPMGCRTGFYLVMFNRLTPADVYDLVIEACNFVLAFDGAIPGATPIECGNYQEQNLGMAKYYIAKYKKELEENKRFVYPS